MDGADAVAEGGNGSTDTMRPASMRSRWRSRTLSVRPSINLPQSTTNGPPVIFGRAGPASVCTM